MEVVNKPKWKSFSEELPQVGRKIFAKFPKTEALNVRFIIASTNLMSSSLVANYRGGHYFTIAEAKVNMSNKNIGGMCVISDQVLEASWVYAEELLYLDFRDVKSHFPETDGELLFTDTQSAEKITCTPIFNRTTESCWIYGVNSNDCHNLFNVSFFNKNGEAVPTVVFSKDYTHWLSVQQADKLLS